MQATHPPQCRHRRRILHRRPSTQTLCMPVAWLILQCHRHTAGRQGQTLHTMGLGQTLCLDRVLGVTVTNRIQHCQTVVLQYMRRQQAPRLSRSLRRGDLPHFRMLREIALTACMVSRTVRSSGCLNCRLANRGTQSPQVLAAATRALTTSTAATGDKLRDSISLPGVRWCLCYRKSCRLLFQSSLIR